MPAFVLADDVASGAVIHHDVRVIDRDVFDALFEVAHRVPSRVHHVTNQPVSVDYRAFWIVDESRLNSTPRL